jgi:GNAT superfamily N-acetyltransferase
VARVHVRSWQVAYQGLIAQDCIDGLRPEEKASRYTFDRTGSEAPATLIAVENEVICGFVTTGPSQDSDLPDVGELWAIYVDPQYWGKVVGRLLVTAGRDQMRRDGAREALLWVFAGNHRAR